MATSSIKLTQDELDSMIGQINNKIQSLRDKLGKLRDQRNQLDTMIGQGDSSAALMRSLVERDILATEKAIARAEASARMLEGTKTNLADYVAEAANILSNAATAVDSGTSKAVQAAHLMG